MNYYGQRLDKMLECIFFRKNIYLNMSNTLYFNKAK